jgi:hypothetical protein
MHARERAGVRAMMPDAHFVATLRSHLAARRALTGQKFETCERMRDAFAVLDGGGWNDWLGDQTEIPWEHETENRQQPDETKNPETEIRETKIRRGRGRPRKTGLWPWIVAGISRATWYRRRVRECVR